MSTRRPRIKAVATLPARRRNTENNESKTKSPKPAVEETRSPQTVLSPTKTSVPSPNVQINENVAETNNIKIPIVPNNSTTKTDSPTIQKGFRTASSPLFLPPSSKGSPARRHAASPKVSQPQKSPTQQLQTASPQFVPAISKRGPDPSNEVADYNPPSIPDSVTEDPLDGIIPLQSAPNTPKPIEILKNEIISENAQVLFDPIVPIPSPSKVRTKLRPTPRFPHRRNSIQGSASESEDEARRVLLANTLGQRQRHDSLNIQSIPNKDISRVRSESFSTPASQPTTHPSQSVPASPLRDKNISKSRRTDLSRRMVMLRRRQRMLKSVRDVKRNELTMYDLIFYNPLTNPIVPDAENEDIVKDQDNPVEPAAEAHTEPAPDNDVTQADSDAVRQAEEEDLTPVPQIKLGPNGEIILDEQSLVIEQTESNRKLSESIVREGAWTSGGRGKYSRAKRTAEWTDSETVRFYRALAAVGTDFTLMEPLFPTRNRKDLKLKFKKEERQNSAQVDKALRSQTQWDGTRLEIVFAKERKNDADRAEKERQAYIEQKRAERRKLRQTRKEGVKISRASKALLTCVPEGFKHSTKNPLTGDAFIANAQRSDTDEISDSPQSPEPKSALKTPYASLSLVKPNHNRRVKNSNSVADVVTITPMSPGLQPVAAVPNNIESGSLVVVTANDPNDPTKKVLQTYISSNGKLNPVSLPCNLLTSVMGYMKKNSTSQSGASSPFMSPNSGDSQENSRSSVIQINPTPSKKMRHDSFNITPL